MSAWEFARLRDYPPSRYADRTTGRCSEMNDTDL